MTTEYERDTTPSKRDPRASLRTPGLNPDPITGEPGAHPVGTGIGAAAGGAAGAAIGSLGGPIGTAIGAAAGAVAGGLAGKGAGEAVNPTAEDAYWRSAYATRPYVRAGTSYDVFAPAYRYGWESYSAYTPRGLTFDQAEPELRDRWTSRVGSTLDWPNAREAIRDAWSRLEGKTIRAGDSRPPPAPAQVETKNANEVRDTLNGLIEICKDGMKGFRLAAGKVKPDHAAMFNQFAAEREAFAAELQSEVHALGGDPTDSGDAAGALHRGWMSLKSALTSGERAVMDECERGEDAAVQAYQKALQAEAPGEVHAVIARQYTKIKSAHDRVSALKHSMQ